MAALREVLARFGISFDDRALKKGDAAVDNLVAKLGGLAIAAASAFAGGALGKQIFGFVDGVAEAADRIGDTAERFGISTDALQEWQYAAKLSGAEAEDLTAALGRLQRGASDSADTFASMGVKVKDANGELKSADMLLEDVAEAFERIENPSERTAKAMKLFGKSGAKLVPLLARGKKGIKQLRAEFKQLGGGFSNEAIEQASKYKDAVDRLGVAWLSFKSRLGVLILPLFEKVVSIGTKVTATFSRWADAVKPIIDRSNILQGVMVALGVALAAAFAPALIEILPFVAAFILLAAVADELITFFQGGETIIGRSIDAMFGEGSQEKVRTFATNAYQYIADFFDNTHKGWEKFKIDVELLWLDMLDSLTSTWYGAALVTLITSGFGQIKLAVEAGAAAFDILVSAIKAVVSGVDSLGSAVSKVPLLGKLGDLLFKGNAMGLGALAGAVRDSAASDPNTGAARRAALLSQRGDLTGRSDAEFASARFGTATAGATSINAPVEVNVTVPPGTPAQQARAVGDAARQGAMSNKAMFNSLVKR